VSALSVAALSSGYGSLTVLRDVSLTVPAGGWVAVLGANGAGKSTLLRTISGLVPPTGGRITVGGHDAGGRPPERMARLGVGHVPENRLVFPRLSVADNLSLGGYIHRRRRAGLAERLERVYALFPALSARPRQLAGTLSGGEQQMLAVGRALMTGPTILMLDEPSIGLAPRVTGQIFDALAQLRATSAMAVLLVEQNAALALAYSDYAYVLEHGRVTVEGTAAQLRDDPRVRAAYLGGVAAEA
jgi:branched-chain amino acid transport system ATP-binding protein